MIHNVLTETTIPRDDSKLIDELRPLADDVSVDRLGKVVAWKRSKNDRRVMLAAHMDEIGFIVKQLGEVG